MLPHQPNFFIISSGLVTSLTQKLYHIAHLFDSAAIAPCIFRSVAQIEDPPPLGEFRVAGGAPTPPDHITRSDILAQCLGRAPHASSLQLLVYCYHLIFVWNQRRRTLTICILRAT